MAAILANPRYTGRQVRNRQRTDFDLVDPANTGLGRGTQMAGQALPFMAVPGSGVLGGAAAGGLGGLTQPTTSQESPTFNTVLGAVAGGTLAGWSGPFTARRTPSMRSPSARMGSGSPPAATTT